MNEFILNRITGHGDYGDFISCSSLGAKFVTFKRGMGTELG